MAPVLARHPAPTAANHPRARRAALRHGHGCNRRIPHPGRIQPRTTDLYVDRVHVGPGVSVGRLVPGVCRGHRLDRRGGNARRGGRAVLDLPLAGRALMAAAQYARPRRKPVKVGTIARHVVLLFFMLIIIVPLAWVILVSIKSIPDAYRPGFWPQTFDFTHYEYVI